MGARLPQDQLKDLKELFDMNELRIKIDSHATNDIGELPPMKLPDANDKDAPKWKRLAPRRPAQQPEQQPKKTQEDE